MCVAFINVGVGGGVGGGWRLTVKENQNSIFHSKRITNKAGYAATPAACGWAGAIYETAPLFGQGQ